MEILVELFFRGLIVDFFGLYSRFYFFKLIGKKRTLTYLKGEEKKTDSTDTISQHVFNVVIGLITFISLSFFVAYLVWGENGF
jgi:uncharacterized membrane protein